MELIGASCEELMASQQLALILVSFLHVGNCLGCNSGKTGRAVRLQGLTTSFRTHKSLVEAVARSLLSDDPYVRRFPNEISSLEGAARLSWPELTRMVHALDADLTKFCHFCRRLGVTSHQENLEASPLGRFVLSACLEMTKLYTEMEDVSRAVQNLNVYFAESLGWSILGELDCFCRLFGDTVRRIDASELLAS